MFQNCMEYWEKTLPLPSEILYGNYTQWKEDFKGIRKEELQLTFIQQTFHEKLLYARRYVLATGDIATVTNKEDRFEKHSRYRMTESLRNGGKTKET